MTTGVDYSKYAKLANQTQTITVNGKETQIRKNTADTNTWSNISSMQQQVNNGDVYLCTDGYDDGEISGTEKAGLFADGMGDSVKEKLPELAVAGATYAIGTVAAPAIGTALAGTAIGAACAAAAPVIAIVGGAALVVTGVLAIGKGISQFIKGSEAAKNATTDSEAKQAWHSMGDATVDTAYGVAEVCVGAKVTKAGVSKAKETGQWDQWRNKADETGTKVKSFGDKVKDFFGKLFKKGKANTAGDANQQLRLEAPKNNSTAVEVEVLDKPKATTADTVVNKEQVIIDAEGYSVNTTPNPQLGSGKNVIYLNESTGTNIMYDGNTHIDTDGYEYAYEIFNM